MNIPTTEMSQLHSASKLHEDATRYPQWSRLYSHTPEGNSDSEQHTAMECKNNRQLLQPTAQAMEINTEQSTR